MSRAPRTLAHLARRHWSATLVLDPTALWVGAQIAESRAGLTVGFGVCVVPCVQLVVLWTPKGWRERDDA